MRYMFLVCAAFFVHPAKEVHAQTVNVQVDSTTGDDLGGRLATKVRERVSNSPLFTLVYGDTPGLKLSMITMDPDNYRRQSRTIYSAAILLHSDNDSLEMMLTHHVGICGSKKLASCADSVIASIDKFADALKTAASDYSD